MRISDWSSDVCSSDLKVEGRRAHAMARAGEAPVLKSRIVDIRRLDLLEAPDPDHAVFEMECGSGTYVRALVRDLAPTGRASGRERGGQDVEDRGGALSITNQKKSENNTPDSHP